MANIFDDGSGNRSASAVLADGDTTLNGFAFTGLDKVGNRSVFFNYSFAQEAKFKVKFRYHNGANWGAWHYLEDDEGNTEWEYDTADAAKPISGICEFLLYNQSFYRAENMRGFQIDIERTSAAATGDITFTNGMEV